MTDADTIRQYLEDVKQRYEGKDLDEVNSYDDEVPKLAAMLEQAVEALDEIATGRYATKTFTYDKHATNVLAAIAKEVDNGDTR